MKPLAFVRDACISGLNTFTFVTADFLLHPGFTRFVTIPHAEFRSKLVVSLCSGWIIQQVNASFAWHTHSGMILALD